MSNEYFTKSGNPAANSAGSSSLMRAEFTNIEVAFDKLPTLSGNGGKLIKVNAGGAAQEASSISADQVVTLTGAQTLSDKILATPIISGTAIETVYSLSGTTPAITPGNGAIQTWTMTGNSTPTLGTMSSGQAVVLLIDDGTAYSITWTSISPTWLTPTGGAPTLKTSGYTVIVLLKIGTTIYGVA